MCHYVAMCLKIKSYIKINLNNGRKKRQSLLKTLFFLDFCAALTV